MRRAIRTMRQTELENAEWTATSQQRKRYSSDRERLCDHWQCNEIRRLADNIYAMLSSVKRCNRRRINKIERYIEMVVCGAARHTPPANHESATALDSRPTSDRVRNLHTIGGRPFEEMGADTLGLHVHFAKFDNHEKSP